MAVPFDHDFWSQRDLQHVYQETAPQESPQRPDSQQQKMNTLQNSSGLSSSLTQRLFIKNLLERKVDYSALMRSSQLFRQLGWAKKRGRQLPYSYKSTPPYVSLSSSQW